MTRLKFKNGCAVAWLAAALLLSASVDAQTPTVISIPVAKREVFFALPQDFPIQPSALVREADSYQAIYYPNGTTEKNWSERIRLLVLQGHLKGVQNPANSLLVDVLAERTRVQCPTNFFIQMAPARSSLRVSAVFGCKSNVEEKKHTVMGYYLVVLGEEDSYVLMRERRISYQSEGLLPAKGVVDIWRKETDTLTICPVGGLLCGKLGSVPQ